MQPAALSVEPLILLSGIVFLLVVLPVSVWIATKWPLRLRQVAVAVGLAALVYIAFNLGRMTGLSMAWYHWKREYKEPLWDWQIMMKENLERGNTNGVVKMAQEFGGEKIQAYGLETLFEKGEFRSFVERVSRLPETSN